MKKSFLLVSLLLTSQLAYATFNKISDANAKYQTEAVIYASKNCDYCIRAGDYLAEKGVDHKLVYIDNNPEAITEMELFGGTSVPVIIINNQVLQGFIKSDLDKAIPSKS